MNPSTTAKGTQSFYKSNNIIRRTLRRLSSISFTTLSVALPAAPIIAEEQFEEASEHIPSLDTSEPVNISSPRKASTTQRSIQHLTALKITPIESASHPQSTSSSAEKSNTNLLDNHPFISTPKRSVLSFEPDQSPLLVEDESLPSHYEDLGFKTFFGTALYDFSPDGPNEMEFYKGDIVAVMAHYGQQWFVARHIGISGRPQLVPVSYFLIHVSDEGPFLDANILMECGEIPLMETWLKVLNILRAPHLAFGVINPPKSLKRISASNSIPFLQHRIPSKPTSSPPVKEETTDGEILLFLHRGLFTEQATDLKATNFNVLLQAIEALPKVEGAIAPDLSEFISRNDVAESEAGGFADVYKATMEINGHTFKVAIKVIRSHIYSDHRKWKIAKRLRREIRVWSLLRHPNVLAFLGVVKFWHSSPYESMVCPWMEDGNLNRYLDEHKFTLTLADRLNLMSDVAEGLSYLHSQSVIHGDITSGNILINAGSACLSDFGLSQIISDSTQTGSFATSTVGGSWRWAAPELYVIEADGSEGTTKVTKACDIYSFGSVMLQSISGRVPYYNITRNEQVLLEVLLGRKTPRPPEKLLNDDLWDFISNCWKNPPNARPTIEDIQGRLYRRRTSYSSLILGSTLSDV